MFVMTLTLVSDFSSVLLDLKDKDIILSKPVTGKTLSAAKTLHIMIYMLYMTIAFIAPSLIAGLIRQGLLFFIVFFIGIILMDIFIVVITALLYLLIVKFFDGEKLRDIINYFQIALVMVMSVGYQILCRLFNISEFYGIEYTHKVWHYIIPPVCFGGPFELVLKGNRETYIIIFTALSILVPIISMIIYNKFTSAFEYNLQKLNETSQNYKSKTKGFNYLLSRLVCRNKEEAAFFRFATNMMKKERNFKLRVYPSLGFSLVFPFIFLLTSLKESRLEGTVPIKVYFSIYFIGFMISGIISTIGFSGNYKGAWIYKVIPLNKTDAIFKGTMKAAIVNLVLPIYIFVSTIFMILFKGKILMD
ncbi:hypothetical protein [Tepidimicrobium xylanilyticum]